MLHTTKSWKMLRLSLMPYWIYILLKAFFIRRNTWILVQQWKQLALQFFHLRPNLPNLYSPNQQNSFGIPIAQSVFRFSNHQYEKCYLKSKNSDLKHCDLKENHGIFTKISSTYYGVESTYVHVCFLIIRQRRSMAQFRTLWTIWRAVSSRIQFFRLRVRYWHLHKCKQTRLEKESNS